MRKLMTGVMVMATMTAGGAAMAASKGKVLVVLSSESKITLQGGRTHATGFFLSELAVPLGRLIEAGYQPVFASPGGTRPVMDRVSDGALWFGDVPGASSEARDRAQRRYREVR